MIVMGVALVWIVGTSALLAFIYRKALAHAWAEPVLRVPVLILESDDWGYGPVVQAQRLDQIVELLARFRDSRGSPPVMTLGVILAGPDTDRIRADGCRTYHRVSLADPRLAPVRDAMLRGVERGVFALQLHGMEHYWPACLMHAAAADEKLRDWLMRSGFPCTEALPSPLQSRWIDVSTLPSRPLPADQVAAAATEEIAAFTEVFGVNPKVVVPSTFVWTDAVESAWVRAGARVVVTPGIRNESRDAEGRVVAGEHTYFNAATGPRDVLYIVRDCYFEPSFGHTHRSAIQALQRNTHVRQPTLLEIHRVNFIEEERQAERTLEEVTRLLDAACAQFSDIRFMDTAELAQHYRDRSDLVDMRISARIHFLPRRRAKISRLRKLAWATCIILPAWLAYLITRPVALQGSH